MKSVVLSRPTGMRGKAVSSGERKIILSVFNHFKTENSSLIENAVITLTFKVPRTVKHGVKSPSKIRPNRKKEFNKLDEFNLGVVRHIIHQVKVLLIFISLRPKFQRFVKTA